MQYFVRTSLLVSVGVCFGMDEGGVDSLGNRRPLEVDRDNSLASDVTVAYNPRSSQPSTFVKYFNTDIIDDLRQAFCYYSNRL